MLAHASDQFLQNNRLAQPCTTEQTSFTTCARTGSAGSMTLMPVSNTSVWWRVDPVVERCGEMGQKSSAETSPRRSTRLPSTLNTRPSVFGPTGRPKQDDPVSTQSSPAHQAFGATRATQRTRPATEVLLDFHRSGVDNNTLGLRITHARRCKSVASCLRANSASNVEPKTW